MPQVSPLLVAGVCYMGCLGTPVQAGRKDSQVIHDYHALVETASPARGGPQPLAAASPRINPFLSYTNIGTDFGFLGPSTHEMSWEPGAICVGFENKEWGGVWHSLAGRADDAAVMDFQRPYPAMVEPKFQPTVTGFRIQTRGTGQLTFELKSADQQVVAQRKYDLQQDKAQELAVVLENQAPAKLLNWVAQPGARLCVDAVLMDMTMPDMSPEAEVALRCYAKLARCYNPSNGLVRDRAHLAPGEFDNMPVSGLFCLASAAAMDLGFVSETTARAILKRTTSLVAAIPNRVGILPHFLKGTEGNSRLHPGTEFSVVDTAIYYQAMLIAAEIMRDGEIAGQLVGTMQGIDFSKLRDSAGHVHHGFQESGEIIPSVWRDWGSESALVLIQQQLGKEPPPPAVMNQDGVVFRDSGFIPELTSLFYPQFNSAVSDLVTHQNWKALRQELYNRQSQYFKPPQNSSLNPLIFGLSAGEGRFGDTYLVSGTGLREQRTIHPHYLFLSWASAPSLADWFQTMKALQANGYFPPWGCVENIDAPTTESLPMLGALNASFEFLSAYHALKAFLKQEDQIYAASTRQPELVQALKIFYP